MDKAYLIHTPQSSKLLLFIMIESQSALLYPFNSTPYPVASCLGIFGEYKYFDSHGEASSCVAINLLLFIIN